MRHIRKIVLKLKIKRILTLKKIKIESEIKTKENHYAEFNTQTDKFISSLSNVKSHNKKNRAHLKAIADYF